jgi:hypothetical protein
MKLLPAMMLLMFSISALADNAKLETCRKTLKESQKLEVLYDLQWKGPTLHVVAGPTYYKIPFDAKWGFADAVNCFAMAGKNSCLTFEIKHWLTGKATDRYHMCKLKPI